LQVDLRWKHILRVDVRCIAECRNVAGNVLKAFSKLEFKIYLANLARQLHRTTRVLQDLGGLNSGDFIEEPSAARVHQHGVSLYLHVPEHLPGFNGLYAMVAYKFSDSLIVAA